MSGERSRLGWFDRAEERAMELAPVVPEASEYVGICGATVGFDSFDIVEGLISVRRVTNPPGVIHVARAADLRRTDYLGVGRYSSAVRAEITVGTTGADEAHPLNLAWHTAALLKLRGHTLLFCPVSCGSSWDTISAISDNSATFTLLDDVSKQIGSASSKTTVSFEDVEWVRSHHLTAFDLRDAANSRRFGLAFNVSYTWNQTPDTRVALANLWVGLEALFGERGKSTTKALAERISTWVPSVSNGQVVALYNERCNAVHGRWLDEEAVSEALMGSDNLLRQALIKCIETNSKTLPDWH